MTCPFPPTPNEMLSRRTTKAQQKKTVSSHRERVSLLSVLFLVRFRVSLSVLFRSLRERRSLSCLYEKISSQSASDLQSNCFRSEIHTQNSGSSVLPRNQPRGIQRIVCQRFEHYWCSATNSSGLVFVFFFARKVCSRWSYYRE